ncbi:MAG: hypothetical protein IT561_22130 [Alphaproteobacteria bacterium]|nr:hypothetical protein [Alphaproteobacteria bacterium]
MADRLALKSLTASDLTFFEIQFRTSNVGNQKSINLNGDVFVDELYPVLSPLAKEQREITIGLPIKIFGPAAAGEELIQRKIVTGRNYKNWRLNGEFVKDPIGQAGRFDWLSVGDLAVMGFDGLAEPRALTLVLLAQSAGQDTALHRDLADLIPGGRKTMVSVTAERLMVALQDTDTPQDHPLWALARDQEVEQALEDAALGGAGGVSRLLHRRRIRPVSPTELRARLENRLRGFPSSGGCDSHSGCGRQSSEAAWPGSPARRSVTGPI